MNYMFPDDLERINRQKIERDRLFLLKEGMVNPGSELTRLQNALGNWMIAKGEKLRRKYSATVKNSRFILLRDETRIFKS